MGIGKASARSLIAAVKADPTVKGRADMRDEIGAAVNLLNEWLSKHDVQMSQAAPDFAATKAAQFKAFTDALPDPVVDQTP